jgi:chemotaxis protein MotB
VRRAESAERTATIPWALDYFAYAFPFFLPYPTTSYRGHEACTGATTMKTTTLMITALTLALGSGCVGQGKYDQALADANRARAALAAERDRRAASELQTAELRQRAIAAEASGRRTRGELSSETERASQCAQALAEVRRLQAAAESRAKVFRETALRLKRMIDSGELSVSLRGGRMVVTLPDDVLFDSGKRQINARGREVLTQVGSVLVGFSDRRFQVAGHTDSDPIRFSGFESNWQLSVERGLKVVELLVKSGMRPESLSIGGYGEFDPVASNDTKEDKRLNRRIEITLQPNIDESVAVPDGQSSLDFEPDSATLAYREHCASP